MIKFTTFVCLTLFIQSCFSQDAAINSLRNAYSSWKNNKPLLEKYILEYSNKLEACKTLKKANEAEIEALKIEKERVRQELLKGSFCDKCNRSKSEIELADKIPFLEHIKNVQGTPIPASPAIIKNRMDEFDTKIQALSYAVMTCDGDAFMLNGKVANYKVYVESNVKTASQNIISINSYLNKELSTIITEKNNLISKLNGMVVETNIDLTSIDHIGENLEIIENKFNLDKKQTINLFEQKIRKLEIEISNIKSQLEKVELQEEEKISITNELGSLNNTKYLTETEYNRLIQNLDSNFEIEKNKLIGDIDNKLNSLLKKINGEINNTKSSLQSLANQVSKILNYRNTNISFINKVISEMKLDYFIAINNNFNSDKLLYTISNVNTNALIKSKIGNNIINSNNSINNCQSLVNDIENTRIGLVN